MSKMSPDRSLDMLIGSLRQSFGDPYAWRASVHRFETDDKISPPAPGGIVFVGSSSFTFWTTMEQDFAPIQVIKRGFGGVMIKEVLIAS